jgi:hypothetical protein
VSDQVCQHQFRNSHHRQHFRNQVKNAVWLFAAAPDCALALSSAAFALCLRVSNVEATEVGWGDGCTMVGIAELRKLKKKRSP